MSKGIKLYTEQKHNLYQIEKALNVDKMYLYKFVGNYKKIHKMPYEIVLRIAAFEQIEPNELYSKMLTYALQNSKNRGD